MLSRRGWAAAGTAALVLGLGAGAGWQLARPLPPARLVGLPAVQGQVGSAPLSLRWPAQGQSSVYLDGFGYLGSSPGEEPVPIASVTKVMTALVVLRSRPLSPGTAGPEVSVGPEDVLLYQQEHALGDSVVAVAAGRPLSELQALQGLLVASGDNLALLLADWVSGSEVAFVGRMNAAAIQLGMDHTHFADPAGLDPSSRSTATDLVRLLRAAMAIPVLAGIVALRRIQLPLGGSHANYNPILADPGVIGVKTGWTAQSLGCLAFAATARVAGREVVLLGAVLGQPGGPSGGLEAAGTAALALLAQARRQLRLLRLPASGRRLGEIRTAWAPAQPLALARPLELVVPRGLALRTIGWLQRLRPPWGSGGAAATLVLQTGRSALARLALYPSRRLEGPSWWWRLFRV
ncbi:MAG: D-alanyl-D-alanine carboxypeptidase family protein [Candidatus Dormibacteria bacterium]